MAIKAVLDKLDDVEEPFRTLYTERNGKFELTGVDGMKTQADVDRLTTAAAKERDEHKKTKGTLTSILGDRKAEDVLALLDRIPELEAAAGGKLDDKKIEELVEKRIGSKTSPLQREIAKLMKDLGDRDAMITEFKGREATRTLHDSIREAVAKSSGFQGAALEDAMLFGERHLTINEEGKVVTKDGVGVTPGVDTVVWLTEMQQKKPHWWGETKGGGATGSKGGGASGDNPFTREHWNVTKQGQIFRENRTRAEQLAKSAGTTVGGGMPVAKK